MSTPADLQALFANLKPRAPSASASNTPGSDQQHHQQPQQQWGRPPLSSPGYNAAPAFGYPHPSVSSPIYSPQVAGTPPHHGSDVISPKGATPRNEQQAPAATNPTRTSDLLNLLKYTDNKAPKPQEEASGAYKHGEDKPTQNGHGRGISASDLVAQFMAKPTAGANQPSSSPSAIQGTRAEQPAASSAAPPGENAQDMLLRLLNRPKSQQTKSSESVKTATVVPTTESFEATNQPAKDAAEEDGEDRRGSPVRAFGSERSRETTPFEPPQPQPTSKGSLFSYVNPFEQLAAASPRPRSAQAGKPRSGPQSPAVETAKGKGPEVQNLNGDAHEAKDSVPQAVASPKILQAPSRRPEIVNSRPEKKLKTKETVPEALEEVAGKVDTEADAALARAVGQQPAKRSEREAEKPQKAVDDEQSANKTSEQPIGEQRKQSTVKPPAEVLAESTKNLAEDAKDEGLADSWESETERIVPVYSFPLKPFVSIAWKGNTPDPINIRDDGFMDIARLKKGFDQLDRSLTSATSEYIVYALAKNSGMRIIRQDDGRDRQVFRSANDRIFHVALCRSGPVPSESKEEAVLGIGVSGSVYWAILSKGEDDVFERDALDSKSLIFPPFPTSDENASGGQLKTRAKPSSRHPKFFAIGRGKSIHIIWPHAAMAPKYGITQSERKVDTEKFLKERALKIATGKAGKDFVFSDDDTVIVSLDKTGRMRFWDISEMGDADSDIPKTDIRIPLLTLVTGTPNEKSWPTSVLFIDKLRPYLKACSLRYVLVGLRQNHTLQLWDIGLGKAVQEINFPHSKESDGICSVAYHPGSGIIVVGHPTRNSIYFIHLSAPRYGLPVMSQAAYIKAVTDNDQKLPRPESTACMSGVRELSFGSRGQLRSLELLPLAKPTSQRGSDEEAGLFELYVMHSRGVTCLTIKKADLGWSVDNKILQSVNALDKGFIEIRDLQSLASHADEQSVNGDGTLTASSSGNHKESIKKADFAFEKGAKPAGTVSPTKESRKKASEPASAVSQPEQAPVEKAEKKKKKKAAETAAKSKEAVDVANVATEATEAQTVSGQKSAPVGNNSTEQVQIKQHVVTEKIGAPVGAATPEGITTDDLVQAMQAVQLGVAGNVETTLKRELDGVYARFDEDRREQDKAWLSRQDQVLRLISSTLSDNVEKNLTRIITGSVESAVIPALKETAAASIDKQISAALNKQLGSVVPLAINKSIPDAVSRAIQSPETLKAISELAAPAIARRVENEVSSSLRNTVIPAFKNEYARSTNKLIGDVEKSFASKIQQFESQHIHDNVKIDQLTNQVQSLTEIVHTMAASQAKFQGEILEMDRRFESSQQTHQEPRQEQRSASASVSDRRPTPQSDEEAEIAEVSQLMAGGKYEEASVKWLQSSQQGPLFDVLFVKYGPSYLSSLSPLVALSVSAAVTSSLTSNVPERLNWLYEVLRTVNLKDPDIVEVVPKIMDVLIQRLDALYMSIAGNTPHDPILRKIPALIRWARDIKSSHGAA